MTWLFLKHNSRYRIQPTDEDNSQLRPVCNRIEGSREQPEPSRGENIRLCVNKLNSHSSPDVQTWSVSRNKTAHDPQHCLNLNHLWPLQSSPPNLILCSIICHSITVYPATHLPARRPQCSGRHPAAHTASTKFQTLRDSSMLAQQLCLLSKTSKTFQLFKYFFLTFSYQTSRHPTF